MVWRVGATTGQLHQLSELLCGLYNLSHTFIHYFIHYFYSLFYSLFIILGQSKPHFYSSCKNDWRNSRGTLQQKETKTKTDIEKREKREKERKKKRKKEKGEKRENKRKQERTREKKR